jgi:ribose-phosphate pyrophosphokinase
VAATHGIFAGPAVERLVAAELNEIVVTDTIPLRPNVKERLANLTVLSVADLIGEAIRRIHEHRSVSALFCEAMTGDRKHNGNENAES